MALGNVALAAVDTSASTTQAPNLTPAQPASACPYAASNTGGPFASGGACTPTNCNAQGAGALLNPDNSTGELKR
jgi:hypothetical protein